jgi:hypothetical protein
VDSRRSCDLRDTTRSAAERAQLTRRERRYAIGCDGTRLPTAVLPARTTVEASDLNFGFRIQWRPHAPSTRNKELLMVLSLDAVRVSSNIDAPLAMSHTAALRSSFITPIRNPKSNSEASTVARAGRSAVDRRVSSHPFTWRRTRRVSCASVHRARRIAQVTRAAAVHSDVRALPTGLVRTQRRAVGRDRRSRCREGAAGQAGLLDRARDAAPFALTGLSAESGQDRSGERARRCGQPPLV